MIRMIVASLLVASSMAAAAFAQNLVPAEPFVAVYDMQPNGQDYARNYPSAAMQRSVEGVAVLCCRATEERRLECASALEWPAGEGFGQASLAVSREFRLNSESYAAYRANPHNWLRRTITWRFTDADHAALERVLSAIREQGQDLCRPDPVEAVTITQEPDEGTN